MQFKFVLSQQNQGSSRYSSSANVYAGICLCLAVCFGLLPVVHAQTYQVPEGFVVEPVVAGLNAPVDMAFANDGRIFIAEKRGMVQVYEDGDILGVPFIDITAETNGVGDRGLIGIALHPRFPDVPYVYLSYVYDPPELQNNIGDSGPDGQGARVSRLIRVSADPAQGYNRVLAGSEVVILGTNSTYENIGDVAERNTDTPSCFANGAYVRDCLPADEHSHTIGRVRFGPDGALYVGSGDGSDFNKGQPYHIRVQSLDSLAGKLLRIDPTTGEGLPDNPFFDGDPNSNASKVLNFGLRNPYSFTFQHETWEPVMADVGWATWEMVKLGSGKNFGWPCYEGGDGVLLQQSTFRDWEMCQPVYGGENGPVEPPIYAYNRQGVGGAIMAGDIYEGDLLPDQYKGALFFADYYQGWIRYLPISRDGVAGEPQEFATVPFPVNLSFGPDGQLLYLNVWGGELVRLRYVSAEPQQVGPTIVANVSPLAGQSPLVVEYDASPSFDADGGPLTFEWVFDGARASDTATGTTYLFAGDHTINLSVTNEAGVTSTATYLVRSGSPAPSAVISEPSVGATYGAGEIISFSGSGIAADGSPIVEEELSWRMLIHYDDYVDVSGLPPATAGPSGSVLAIDRGENALELCLSVTDASQVEAETCVFLQKR